ncbi:helix-turn-helix domain-containing protein [Finegoldia magna]|nr:helix-turn-helix domain-containing protein [Finegoldia magna]
MEEYIKPLGLFQTRLSKKVGISRISINYIETGKTIPRLKTANDTANALRVCMYQVFDLDGEEPYKCHDHNCC